MTEFAGWIHAHGRFDGGETGHIARAGKSLCGFERSHMNIETVEDDFENWISENKDMRAMCRRCLARYKAIAAKSQP